MKGTYFVHNPGLFSDTCLTQFDPVKSKWVCQRKGCGREYTQPRDVLESKDPCPALSHGAQGVQAS